MPIGRVGTVYYELEYVTRRDDMSAVSGGGTDIIGEVIDNIEGGISIKKKITSL